MKTNKYLFTLGLTANIVIFIIAMSTGNEWLLNTSLLLLFFITPFLLFIPRIIEEAGVGYGVISLIINVFSLPIVLFSAILPLVGDMIEVLVNPKNEKKLDIGGMLLINLAFYLYITLIISVIYMVKQGLQSTAPRTDIAPYMYYSLCAILVLITIRVSQWAYNAMDKMLPLSMKTLAKHIEKNNTKQVDKQSGTINKKPEKQNNKGPIDLG